MGFLGDDVSTAMGAAPDLLNNPSLLLGAAQSPDPGGTAQMLSQANSTVAMSNAIKEHSDTHGPGFVHQLFGGIGHAIQSVGHVVGQGLEQMARPLGDVQHDYRYIRDVYTHHGFFAGISEQLGIFAAGAAGTIASGGNPAAGILAADAVASLEQRLFFKDSAARTKNAQAPGYQPGISPGRDLAHLFGLSDTTSGFGKVVSGLTDATFDITTDPFLKGLSINSARKSVEGWTAFKGYRAAAQGERQNALSRFIDTHAPGMGIRSGEDGVAKVDAARTAYSGYRNALKDMARLDAGGIIRKYGRDYDKVAAELGQAKTADEVHTVFRDIAGVADFRKGVNKQVLPSRSLLRVPFSAAAEALRNIQPEGVAADQKGVVRAVGDSLLHPSQMGQNLAGAVARKVRTFSGVMPFAIDKGTGELSSKTFNPTDGSGLQGILQSLSFSLGEKPARQIVTDFALADTLAEKKDIYTAGLTKAFIAAGLPADHELVGMIDDMVGQHVHAMGDGELFGRGLMQGEGVSSVQHAGGTDQLALHATEASHQWSFPDFFQLRNAVRDLHAYSRVYGKADDAAAHYYTNGFFKPLALVSMGFALRVAASEMIPATFRYGAANMLAGSIAKAAAKQNYKLSEGEDGHILAATSRMVGGLDHLVNNEADRALANDLAIRTQGHMVWGVAGTGTNPLLMDKSAPVEAAQKAWFFGQRKTNLALRADTESWKSLTRDDRQFQDYWLTNLQKRTVSPAGRLIAKDLAEANARGMDAQAAHEFAAARETARIANPGDVDPYAAERKTLARYEIQEAQDFAAARVDDMHNLLRGDDGTFHTALADKVAAGTKPMHADLDAIDVLSHPAAVVGNPTMPYLGGNLLQRFVNAGYKKVIDPVINHVSREPIFFQAVKQNRKLLQGFVDSGAITEEEALTRAMRSGVMDMLPQIHNTALRSQFSMLARNFLPFYFAQEQAMKRAGYLVSKNPEALRKYQLVEHGLSDSSFVHTDDQGNRSLMIPLVGELGKGVLAGAQAIGLPVQAGLPLSVEGNLASLATVLPEMKQPGVSPLGAIALNKLAAMFPELSEPVKGVLGQRGYASTLRDQLIPNSAIRNVIKGMSADETDRGFSSAFASALAAAAYHGQLPPADATPAEQQAFLDRIKNNTRTTFFIKAILSAVSPLSPSVTETDSALVDEFRGLVKDKPYSEAVQEFIARHGSKAISYTAAKSDSTTGSSIPYTTAAINWINANQGLIEGRDTQLGAAYLVPQAPGPGDVQTIHEEMLRMHLRSRRTPEEFRSALYVSQGNREYFDDYKVHKDAVAALGADKAGVAAEQANWNEHLNDLKMANPVWAAEFFSPVAGQRAMVAATQLGNLLASGKAPAGEQTELVKELWHDFQSHLAALAQLGTDRSTGHARQVERDNWTAYLEQREAEEPRLSSLISSVFKQIDRTGTAALVNTGAEV